MLYSIVKPNTYQDSLRLLHLSNALNGVEGVSGLSIVMGTPANKEVLRAAGRVEGRNVGMKSFVVGALLAFALMTGAVAEDARNVNIVNETGYGIKFLGFNNPGDDDWSDNELRRCVHEGVKPWSAYKVP